jgi:glyoxylase-like metal-dependent hydrolase (beta-lactamase superfamily II)
MDEGDVFDLGRAKLEVFAIPGHTQGSVALLNRLDNYAYIGDAVGPRTALVSLPPEKRKGLTVYRDGLARFMTQVNENTRLYSGHSQQPMPHEIINDMILACSEVLDGNRMNDIKSESLFSKRLQAGDKQMYEHKTGCVTLVYDANTL